jgi:multidrug efflux pump
VRLSIREVVKTLFEASILVVLVIFVFLQTWRATLIPAIAVPVVLLGTFGVLAVFGFTINTLTLFAMVLAIGLLVDDAIVVVENVERVMREEPGISAREATIRSMEEIQTALIAIALVLSAVFLPMAFFGGSVGQIYRQFSITMVAAMVLSVGIALILTPALTASLLDGHGSGHRGGGLFGAMHRVGDRFTAAFERMTARYRSAVQVVLRHRVIAMSLYVVLVGAMAVLFVLLPTSFLPVEDQGRAQLQYNLPPGATLARTTEMVKTIENYFVTEEKQDVNTVYFVMGQNPSGTGQNVGRGFVVLAPWDQRKGAQHTAAAITQRATEAINRRLLRDGEFFALNPPAVRGLGQASGFTMELLNTGALSREQFLNARNRLIDAAKKDPMLTSVRVNSLDDTSTLSVTVDDEKVGALGLTQSDVDATLTTAWGGTYVNDFIDRGRVKRVYVQGDAPFRSRPEDLAAWHVRTANGSMAPFSTFARTAWKLAPTALNRFNGSTAYEIQGGAAPGRSTGEAMQRIEELAAQIPGTSTAWAGMSFEERRSSGQAPLLYAISLIVVFLCLAALYESWSIPVSVLLVVPLGLLGAVLAVWLRGLYNDVYFQVGLLTTMGLASKNAILIVEYAEKAEKAGRTAYEAALEAARLRLRPIVMTSLAFIFGVMPLALATGAGALSRIAIGTAVIGGMIAGTILAVLFVPLSYVLVRGRKHKQPATA